MYIPWDWLDVDGTSEILREWPGCRRWKYSPSARELLIGVTAADVLELAAGDASAACFAGFISKSSCELVELLELSTGEAAESPLALELSMVGSLTEPLLDERLARPESIMTLSTSFPLTEPGWGPMLE